MAADATPTSHFSHLLCIKVWRPASNKPIPGVQIVSSGSHSSQDALFAFNRNQGKVITKARVRSQNGN